MKKSPKILFLSASIGSGHRQAAVSIAQAMKRLQHDIVVEHIDILDFVNKFFRRTLLSVYFKSLIFIPQVYKKAYTWGNRKQSALWMRKIISAFFAKQLKIYLKTYRPDVVVCTHATPANVMQYLKEHAQMSIPSVSVITDFTVHQMWINQDTKQYFVAEDSLIDNLIKYHIKQERSYALGIPVSVMYERNYDKNKLLKCMKFCDKTKIVLIMGGGAGIFPMLKVIQCLNSCTTAMQLIVVTGENKNLYRKVQKMQSKIKHDMHIFGFVHNIYEFMAVSDILISKAGGVTVSEALCSALPMIIYQPIPGQEEENTKFLLRKKVAIKINKISTLKKVIDKIFRIESNVLTNMKINARQISKPSAAKDIASCILNQLCK